MRLRELADHAAMPQDRHREAGSVDLSRGGILLFCLPYAGGGASAFRLWRNAFPSTVSVQPVQLPGRETRITEPPRVDVDEIAQAIAARVKAEGNRPYAIYGHSMGARLGFEVVRTLRRLGAPAPQRLYVGGCCPPDVIDSIVRLAKLPDDEFVKGLEDLGGTPPGALDHPELRELFLPLLRADFTWLDQYRFHEEEPLAIPIVGFAGLADRSVQPEQMAGWARHTSAGFQLHTVPGDHFFLTSDLARVSGAITRDLVGIAPADHRFALPGTDWQIWRRALLRTTGFPAQGLTRLSCPDLASVADSGDTQAFPAAYETAAARLSREIWAIADEPLFREAVTWQNRNALYAVDGIRKQGPQAARNSKRRQREEMIAQYWQRYCAKNETVGFFGPYAWIDLDPHAPAVDIHPGPRLVSQRQVFFEHWALAAFADTVAADPRVQPWLVPAISPQLFLQDRALLRVTQAPLPLSLAEATLLGHCDGRRPAIEVASRAATEPGSPLRTADDALILLRQLADRGLVRWDLDLPVRMEAEQVLEKRLTQIGDAEARQAALAGLARLRAARDALVGGDPETLAERLSALDETFFELTLQAPQRRAGQMYAGRTLVVEECVRDVEATVGGAVLKAMAAPMGVLLQAARWLCAASADAYLAVLRDFYTELARDLGTGDVPFGQMWYLAQGTFFGTGERPIDDVSLEFTRRWAQLFQLDRFGPEVGSVTLTSAELADAVRRVFPGDRPAWAAARIHSPDLHINAASAEALARGEFTLALGELHAAWSTFDAGLFLVGTDKVEELRAAALADMGPGRALPLFPLTWPRHTARLAASLDNETDAQLGFMPAPGADPDRLVPVTALTVSNVDGELIVHGMGRRWPLIEMFAELIAIHTQGAFKLVAATGHTPRITVDRMVLARETWRTTVAATGLADVRGEQAQYLAVRRLRAGLGLPETVFVSFATETKPCYVDFSSPVYVSIFCSMVRAARLAGGDEVPVVITEMLPGPEDAWVPDAAGHRYSCELRVQICDPEPA